MKEKRDVASERMYGKRAIERQMIGTTITVQQSGYKTAHIVKQS